MKNFPFFLGVNSAPPISHRRLFACAVFLTFFAFEMGAQGFVNPGNIQFQNTNGDDPSGMRRMDVYWDDFVIPPSTDPLNYTLDVRVNVGTNSLVGACISQQLSQAYVHPNIPANTLTVSGNSISLIVPNIEDLGLNALEGTNPILLFSIVFIGAPNSTITTSWQPFPFVPRIWAISGGTVPAWPMTTLNNNRLRNIVSNTISGSIYKPAFTQSVCGQGQNNAVTQVQITKTPNVTCGTTLVQSTITNNTNGTYSFSNIPNGSNLSLPSYFDYTISPSKTNGITCGLDGQDITLVQAHSVGNNILDYPYQMIAGDMNLNGLVTAFDAVIIQRVINGNMSDLPASWRSWAFPPTAAYGTFPAPSSSSSPVPVFNEFLQFNDLNSNFTIQDFVGIKRGDVDGSCSQCNAAFDGGGVEDREANPSNSIILSDRAVRVGETIELPIQVDAWDEDNNVISFALHFDQNYFDVLTVKDGQLPNFDENSFNWEAMDEGLLRCVWVNNYGEKHQLKKGDALFYVVLKAKANLSSLKDLVQIRPDVQDCSVVTTALKQDFLDLRFVQPDMTNELSNVMAYPNPFGDELNLVFNQEADGEVTLEVLSLDGRKLYVSNMTLSKGTQTVSVPSSNFPSGLLAYRVVTSNKEFSGRVVKR
ncbi:MAG: T9SS type A sorting domain-containing protein [Saprospiraceae bacterium]|nr:T9SS type A sorting domain-containing protein [Saprospiraceae bacterium]MCF8252311.1 T9SS type A sorting domain-containing protein [Saprospiraceae bacterium]MCF8282158.1 T9SS type A sorting domain-containing protein [Bacteroidales bacterium]MCF8313954.1 T9SS type A sorting domain-containing protein [Saprospiraceae bacterium]MCF8442663.1 T9SS type A sorting domain-containing protein [Saprospiraceae bacterium]